MLLKALKPWFNKDHEGTVEAGQQIEASEFRANELIRAGLAIPAVDENQKIQVPSDPPRQEAPKPREEDAEEEPAHPRGRHHRSFRSE